MDRFFVPGRIEVLGKHTDYAGGASLLAATEQGLRVEVERLAEPILELHAEDLGETARFSLDRPIPPAPGHWSDYFRVTARRSIEDFPDRLLARAKPGRVIRFGSDLPLAAGLSSSSALVVAAFLALTQDGEQPADVFPDGARLAAYLGAVENGQPYDPAGPAAVEEAGGEAGLGTAATRGVGTHGGSQDHTAILLSRPGRLGWWRFAPIQELGEVPMPASFVFAVAVSGVRAEKTGAAREAYNRASRLAREAAALWREATGRDDPHLAAAVAAAGTDDVLSTIAARCRMVRTPRESEAIHRRTRHFLLESEILVPAAITALRDGDLEAFGILVDRSQRAAEELLGNQVAETIALQRSARELGAVAASAFGAGFGGSVWALVEASRGSDFLHRWRRRYHRAFPQRRPRFFLTTAGGGARAPACGELSCLEKKPERRSG